MKLRIKPVAALALATLLWGWVPAAGPPVADAAMRGEADAVRALLDGGADVNEAQGDGMTALHWAAHNGDAELVALLLKAGARVDATTRIGSYTPLHVASRMGSGPAVRTLLRAGADPRAVTSTTGVQPIHLAAESGSTEAVGALLAHGAEVDTREESWGQTPLMFAAAYDRVEVIEALLAGGADPDLRARVWDIARRAEVDDAAERERNRVLREFEAEHEKTSDEPWVPTLEQRRAAVMAARALQWDGPTSEVERREWDMEEYAPWSASYPELMGYEGGLTALLMACREGHVASALALLDGGADIDQVSAGDETSPLLMAAIGGFFDLALELVGRGADPTLSSLAGATPLYATLNRRWIPRSRHPQTPDFRQQRASHLELMEALLEAGADPNARLNVELWYQMFDIDHEHLFVQESGMTPFLRAAHALDVDAMKLLVRYGADPGIPSRAPERKLRIEGQVFPDEDFSGLPPVPVGGPGVYPIHAASGVGFGQHYAAANYVEHVPGGWVAAVKYLVEELGADVNARDYSGYTPLHHAASRGDNDLVRYLLSKGADPLVVARTGQTTVDMANSPFSRISPYPETIELLESLGAKNNHDCQVC